MRAPWSNMLRKAYNPLILSGPFRSSNGTAKVQKILVTYKAVLRIPHITGSAEEYVFELSFDILRSGEVTHAWVG